MTELSKKTVAQPRTKKQKAKSIMMGAFAVGSIALLTFIGNLETTYSPYIPSVSIGSVVLVLGALAVIVAGAVYRRSAS